MVRNVALAFLEKICFDNFMKNKTRESFTQISSMSSSQFESSFKLNGSCSYLQDGKTSFVLVYCMYVFRFWSDSRGFAV